MGEVFLMLAGMNRHFLVAVIRTVKCVSVNGMSAEIMVACLPVVVALAAEEVMVVKIQSAAVVDLAGIGLSFSLENVKMAHDLFLEALMVVEHSALLYHYVCCYVAH